MYRKGNNNGGLKGEAPHKLQGWVWGAGRSPASRMDRGSVGFEETPPPTMWGSVGAPSWAQWPNEVPAPNASERPTAACVRVGLCKV